MTSRTALLLLLIAALLSGCRSPLSSKQPPTGGSTAALEVTPTEGTTPAADWDWPVSSPQEQGIDPAPLAQMLEAIPAKMPYLHSALVIRNGVIVSENYFMGHEPSTRHVQYSVTKSVSSALIGIAIEQGYIQGVEQRVLDFFPGRNFKNMDARKEAMTLEDVLTMRTGLSWQDGDPYWGQIYRSPDWLEYMLGLPLAAAPGKKFNYCSGCSHILSAILYETTAMTPQEFAEENLFGPLGIQGVEWESDSQGISVGGWGLELSAREMARFGELYLRKGNWLGRQLVPAAWVEESTRPRVKTGEDLRYGYQWWYSPDPEGYAAIGLDGQMIFVRPASQLVVVFTAGKGTSAEELELIRRYILPALRQ